MKNRIFCTTFLSIFILTGFAPGVVAQAILKKKTLNASPMRADQEAIKVSYTVSDPLSKETIKYSAPTSDSYSKETPKTSYSISDLNSKRTLESPIWDSDPSPKGALKKKIRAVDGGGGKFGDPSPVGQAIRGNKFKADSPTGAPPIKGGAGAGSSQSLSKGLISSGKGDTGPDVCATAEPAGMSSDYQKCSRDCKTVCAVKTSVSGVNCFICQEGGDDTCADIGQWDVPHPWCEPGGICHKDPMLVCSAPFDAVGPRRSKLKCTNCKKRPDMCWQKVKDWTMTYTNCMTGCWDGTCIYKGKYKEKEWDGADDIIHCYECITPPPPPTCEDMKWGYDWEMDCLRNCEDPDFCQEFLMTMAGDAGDDDDDDDGDDGDNGGEDGDGGGGGTKTRDDDDAKDDDDGRRGGGGGTIVNPPMGDPSKLGGKDGATPTDPDGTKAKPKGPCEEIADSLRGSDFVENEIPEQIENQKKNMERFKKSLAKLKEKAKKVDEHLKGSRAKVQSLGEQLNEAESALKTAKSEARGAENLGGYGKIKLAALKKAQTKASKLRSEYSQASTGLSRQTASFSKDINTLKRQALKDLYRADPNAKKAEALGRTDQYYEMNRDLSRLNQRREMSDRIFAEKAQELQSKIDQGGSKAEDYQQQLDNLNLGKKAYDKVFNSRERNLKQMINYLQKQNGEDGVGPFDQRGLYEAVGDAAMELSKERNKLKRLQDIFKKAVKNNCPPKGAQKAVDELDQRMKEIDAMIETFEDRQKEIEDGYPISDEEKASIEANIESVAEGTKKFAGEKSMASFYLESQAEELARTFDPTDPRVGLKKAFWYTVGVVEGVGKAIKGLIDLGIGALDLIGETAAKYAGFEDGGIFGTDASAVLQKVLGGVDGNMNLDGLEKLAQGIDKAISGYFKKLSRSKDLDKATARAGGRFAGELIVGDKVIGGIVKGGAKVLGSVARGVKGKPRGFGTGGGTPRGPPPKTPDIDGFPPKAPDGVPPGTSVGGKIAGKADDVPPAAPGAPKKPRAPPVRAKDFKGKTLPDQKGVKPKPLDDATAAKLEKENGFRKDHAKNMHELAQKKGIYMIVRDGNPDSVKFMKDPNKMPKPMSAKAKTAKAGPESNKGLVVDPTHPQQVKYWDADIAAAKASGDMKKVAWLEENRAKAVKTWKSYGDEMKGNGYSVNKKTGVVEYTDPVTGKHFDGVHGDYDLHGVFKPAQGAAGPKKVSFGSGQKFDKHGVDVEGGAFRKQFNDAIDPDKRYVQHGGQDDWIPDSKKVPHKGPDPPVTVFMPDGSTPVRLETAADMKKFYQETMGVKWEY